jgi:hypothetical protein
MDEPKQVTSIDLSNLQIYNNISLTTEYYRTLEANLRTDLRSGRTRIVVILFGATVLLLGWVYILVNTFPPFGLLYLLPVPLIFNAIAYLFWLRHWFPFLSRWNRRAIRAIGPDADIANTPSALDQIVTAAYIATYEELVRQTRFEAILVCIVVLQIITAAVSTSLLIFL